jgi:hypothetical protein
MTEQTDAAEVEWWITTHFLDKGGKKVMGPFVSRDLAIEVRVLREAFEGRCDYFVDSCPTARAAAAAAGGGGEA